MTEASSVDRPNILLLCTDQQRFSALGAYGNTEIHTPHLDALAARGMLFENCYVQSPVCSPSRASLMSGQYVHSHGLWANGVSMPEGTRLLPQALAEVGYDCGLVGKWHLEACFGGRTEPPSPGMTTWRWAHDPYLGSPANAYHRWLAEHHGDLLNTVIARERGQRGRTAGVMAGEFDVLPTAAHYSHWVAEETIGFLREERDAPFFWMANFFDPHHSFGAPAAYRDRYDASTLAPPHTTPDELAHKPPLLGEASRASYAGAAPGFTDHTAAEIQEIRANYYAMVSLVDDEVGRIVAELDRLGLTDNTVIVFSSDHGEMLGDHQLLLKGPFLYDDAVRVPLIITGPGFIPARRHTGLVQWIDLTRTLVEVAGAELAAGQGEDLSPVLSGAAESIGRDWVLSEYRNSGHPYDPPAHVTMIRCGQRKLVIHHGSPASERDRDGEMYDLDDDPHELVNLFHDPSRNRDRREMTELLVDVLVAAENRSAPRQADW